MEDMERLKKASVLLTGNTGYIGTVLAEFLNRNSYRVVGFDSNWFAEKTFFSVSHPSQPKVQITKDMRLIEEKDTEGIDAVIHLAGLSNDPLGELNPKLTEEINYASSVKLADICKKKGIGRFIFSSSCSSYGIASNNAPIDEGGALNPVTSYAKTKVRVEQKLLELGNDKFHPTLMRNATVYGLSPRLRLDLVVNNLVAWGYLTGEINITSDGTPWRPVIHIRDLCDAFLTILKAPAEKVYSKIFNIGFNEENYRIREIAQHVFEALPKTKIKVLNKTGPDERTYKVDFSGFKNTFPEFKMKWGLKKGIQELLAAYKKYNLTMEDFESDKYFRIRTIKSLLESGRMDRNLMFKKRLLKKSFPRFCHPRESGDPEYDNRFPPEFMPAKRVRE